jgi:hypothetical protein
MPKRKRPRSKPDLVNRLCDAIKELTAERAARSYGAQWIALSDVARHLGISDEEAQEAAALGVARHRVQTDDGEPPHSVALYRGLREG